MASFLQLLKIGEKNGYEAEVGALCEPTRVNTITISATDEDTKSRFRATATVFGLVFSNSQWVSLTVYPRSDSTRALPSIPTATDSPATVTVTETIKAITTGTGIVDGNSSKLEDGDQGSEVINATSSAKGTGNVGLIAATATLAALLVIACVVAGLLWKRLQNERRKYGGEKGSGKLLKSELDGNSMMDGSAMYASPALHGDALMHGSGRHAKSELPG
ncbi:hypothetical protein BJ508DRAFT_330033 [Ascobolus immersus RN42]|uniref:Uncharacterized protein n=1 Tax=Ascobolus immersus RN42 TaxID=1160509 RepID=A0A3N4HUY6_ASCIM|nr:hypothetical protein BJ508DRAFT_330033 [Ascobolus immersus RN42]